MSGKNQGGQRIRISGEQAFRFIIYFAMGESSILTIYYLVGPQRSWGLNEAENDAIKITLSAVGVVGGVTLSASIKLVHGNVSHTQPKF